MKTIKDLKNMIAEPASKEWFKKHGTPKSKALNEKKIVIKKSQMLSEKEQKEKTKNWPKSTGHKVTENEKSEFQKKTGRGYNE